MISAGNDIIALDQIDVNRTKEQRFYSKFILPTEIEIYAGGELPGLSFENFVWLLWSVKESVYKFCKRNSSQLVFSPGKITVQSLQAPPVSHISSLGHGEIEDVSLPIEACWQCVAATRTGTYYARSYIYNEVIHTVVNNMDNFDRVCWGIKHSDSAKPESQSESVRHLILDKFSTIYPNARLAISKTQTGYPVLNVNEEEMDIPISFSHHGSFVAYAFNYNYP